jgi:predicted nucleotidyltransferase
VKIVENYIAEVKKNYIVDAALLFGSYVKGTQHENSDIDVALVIDVKNKFDEIGKLYAYTWNIDTRIEPHLIYPEDFNRRDDFFINEIIRTGIRIV